jgi:hypothetical protein
LTPAFNALEEDINNRLNCMAFKCQLNPCMKHYGIEALVQHIQWNKDICTQWKLISFTFKCFQNLLCLACVCLQQKVQEIIILHAEERS